MDWKESHKNIWIKWYRFETTQIARKYFIYHFDFGFKEKLIYTYVQKFSKIYVKSVQTEKCNDAKNI